MMLFRTGIFQMLAVIENLFFFRQFCYSWMKGLTDVQKIIIQLKVSLTFKVTKAGGVTDRKIDHMEA